VAKPEWGIKRHCQSCGAKFYDFGRSPIVCPACGTVFDVETLTRSRRARPAARETAEEEPAAHDEDLATEDQVEGADELEADEDEDVVAPDEDEEDAAVIEDASDLGDDEDVSEVIDDDLDEDPDRRG
jgi:uncharacterized protein (TIGR02300 family)